MHCAGHSTGPNQSNQRLPGANAAAAEPPLSVAAAAATSFSFNSYQDILTNSTFSAADMNRSLAARNLQQLNQRQVLGANSRQPRQQQQHQLVSGSSQLNLTSTFNNANSISSSSFKRAAHSRHRSIGRLNELLLSTESPVVELHSLPACQPQPPQTPTPADNKQQVVSRQQQRATASICSSDQVSRNHQLSADKGHQEEAPSVGRSSSREPQKQQVAVEPEVEPAERSQEMSQTMQSIHSLSMQLNQAAQLASSDIGCSDEQQQQPAPVANTSSTSKLSKLVGKKALRAKELLLQNLGKADKTTDELFQLYEENFYKQQSQALRLQKEFKSYLASLKGAHDSSRTLNRCIQQSTGDYQSARHDLVCENLSQLEHLNEDLLEKLRNQVLVSISEYLSQFNELREKIAKRRRKLIDYDSSRRVYEIMLSNINKKRLQIQQQQGTGGLQGVRSFRSAFTLNSQRGSSGLGPDSIHSATNQLVDEARLLKLREQYNYCKIMYETINGELYEELPMLYEKKMKHLLMSLQNYFSLESQFHSNAGKLFATASDVIEELPMSIHPARHPAGVTSGGHQTGGDGEFNKAASSSSGMGSSRGDSSLESSSSLDNSTNGSPVGGRHPVRGGGADDEDDDEVIVGQVVVREEVTSAVQQVEEVEQEEEAIAGEEEAEEGREGSSGKELAPAEEEPALEESGSPPVELPATPQPGTSEDSCAPGSPRDSPVPVVALEQVVSAVSVPVLAQSANVALSEQQVPEQRVGDEKEALKQVASEPDSGSVTDAKVAGCSTERNNKTLAMHRDAQGSEHKCLYKVKTSYKYLAEDVDELCFEADEILQVIEFENGQEQEEGWLMGLREVNGQKGLFPANFTRPI